MITMADENPSIISHVSIGTNDQERALSFYDRVLATIGAKRILDFPGAVGYGKAFPEFWVQTPFDGGEAGAAANGVHFSFLATSQEQVDAFHAAAMEAGGSDDGAPGLRPDYGESYYACFVLDPDGNKIEAMLIDE